MSEDIHNERGMFVSAVVIVGLLAQLQSLHKIHTVNTIVLKCK